ncbi:MAG: M28 family metallopeptidase [Spirochaetales bacterium]
MNKHQKSGVTGTAAMTVLTLALLLAVAPGAQARGTEEKSKPASVKPERIEAEIERLASPQFAGRLTGDEGNTAAAKYLAAALAELGYEGVNGGPLLEWYTQPVVVSPKPPSLTINDGTSGATFSAGQVDVLIRAGAQINGTVDGPVIELPDRPTPEWVAANQDAILLIDAQRFGTLTSQQELMAALFHPSESPQAFVLEMPTEFTALPRGVFLTDARYPDQGPMLAQVTSAVASQIRAAGADARLRITSRYEVTEREVPKIVATRADRDRTRQSNTDAPVIISAHFDGTGDFGDQNRYPSAIDNASGTAVVLEIARAFADASLETDRPLWFVFFNGEEQGLYGSRAFVNRHREALRGALVLNVDMVGHENGGPILVTHASEASRVAGALVALLEEQGVRAAAAEGAGSDHVSFAGVAEAVSIVQSPYRDMHQQGDIASRAKPGFLAVLTRALYQFAVAQ